MKKTFVEIGGESFDDKFYEDLFKDFDTDGDGYISRTEMAAVLTGPFYKKFESG